MSKKQRNLAIAAFILTASHLFFYNFYDQLSGWMNLRDYLPIFQVVSLLLRLAFLLFLVIAGFKNIQNNRKLLVYYLVLFFFNLILLVLVS